MITTYDFVLDPDYYCQFVENTSNLIQQLNACTDEEVLFRALTLIPDILESGVATAYYPAKDWNFRMFASTDLENCKRSLNLNNYPDVIDAFNMYQFYLNDKYPDLDGFLFPIFRMGKVDVIITLDAADLPSALFDPFITLCSALTWSILRTGLWQNSMRNRFLTKASISGDDFKILLDAYRYAERVGVSKSIILRGDKNVKNLKQVYECIRHTDYVGVYKNRVYILAVNAEPSDALVIIQRLRNNGFYFDKVNYEDVIGV